MQWADVVEEQQMIHLIHTKEQLEYVRLNKEYDFVKKRALVNFLSNSRAELEHHFHSRAQSMLSSIERYEQTNLKNLLNSIGKGALEKVTAALKDPSQSAAIKDAAFKPPLLVSATDLWLTRMIHYFQFCKTKLHLVSMPSKLYRQRRRASSCH